MRTVGKQHILIDGELVFRASYSAGKHFKTSDGTASGGIFLFLKALRAIINHEPCGVVCVAWDTIPSWRHKFYPEYKGTRNYEKTADDTKSEQRKAIRDILTHLRIIQYRGKLHEADDIASWVGQSSKIETKFVTTDSDWLQLVKNGRTFYDFKTKKKIDVHNFSKETDFYSPDLVASAKAIVGDDGDNIPGAPGVGIKTAIKFLRQEKISDHMKKLIDEWVNNPNGYLASMNLTNLVPYRDDMMEGNTIDAIEGDWRPADATRILTQYEMNSLTKDFSFFDDLRLES